VGFREVSANRDFATAVRKLEAALANEEGGLLSKQEVERMIGRSADGPPVNEGGESKVSYTWRGVFRTYHLGASYTQSRPHLLRISTGPSGR
jgi:hypothetical protein